MRDIKYTIYGLKRKDFDEIRYIGITKCSLNKRLSGHKSNNKNNPKKKNWVTKYKNQIEIVLIEDDIIGLKEANKKEIEYIKLFKSFGANLLNATIGGDGTKGTKAWNKDKECSYKQKLSDSSTTKKSVCSYNLKGDFIKHYNSIKEASIDTGISRSSILNISKQLSGHRQSKGFQFRFFYQDNIEGVKYDEKNRLEKSRIAKNKNLKKIKITDMITKASVIYKNACEASSELTLKRISILIYCGSNKIVKNKLFEYA